MSGEKLVKFEMLPREGDITLDSDAVALLRQLACRPDQMQALLRCAQRAEYWDACAQRMDQSTRATQQRCDAMELLLKHTCCPGNVNFSQRTLDEYSDDSQVNLEEVVKDMGGDFVNAFPVPPTKMIRLTHRARPGYTPSMIAIDLNVAGNGNNYLDFTLQFYLVPGGSSSALGLEVGPLYRGNQYLNKDGTQIRVKFPEYRAMPIDVGSLETLAIVIKNNGAANNLDSAFVSVYYDNTRFYELCKAKCSGSCAVPPSMPVPQ